MTLDDVNLSNDDRRDNILLRVGQNVVLSLNENPSTGYRWTSHADRLRLVANSYSADEPAATGGGGLRILRYVASEPGLGVIQVTLSRPWEPEEKAIEQRSFSFQIA